MSDEKLEWFKKTVPQERWKISPDHIDTVLQDFLAHFEKNLYLQNRPQQEKRFLMRVSKIYIKKYLPLYPDEKHLCTINKLSERLLFNTVPNHAILEMFKIIMLALNKIKDEKTGKYLKEKFYFDFSTVFSYRFTGFHSVEINKLIKDSSIDYVFDLEKGIKIHLETKNRLLNLIFLEKSDFKIKPAKECEFTQWLKEDLSRFVDDKEVITEVERIHETFHLIAEKIVEEKDRLTKILLLQDIEELSLKLIFLLNKIYTEALSYVVLYDILTKVFNRVMLDSLLYKLAKHSLRYKDPISLIIFDIDDFKSINDTYGHLKGDEVLKTVANITKASLRESDYIFRFGGEEFLLLLPNTDIDGAIVVGEKVRKNVENFDFGLGRKVTISCGIKQLENLDNPYLDIEEADKYLYVAKRKGKNRCVCGSTTLSSKD